MSYVTWTRNGEVVCFHKFFDCFGPEDWVISLFRNVGNCRLRRVVSVSRTPWEFENLADLSLLVSGIESPLPAPSQWLCSFRYLSGRVGSDEWTDESRDVSNLHWPTDLTVVLVKCWLTHARASFVSVADRSTDWLLEALPLLRQRTEKG